MEKFNDIKRPSESLINSLSALTSATASGELSRMGIKDASITGPVTYNPGKKNYWPRFNFAIFTYSRRCLL